jgi:hypothetical protein
MIVTKTASAVCSCDMPIMCICGKNCRICGKDTDEDTMRRYQEAYNKVAKEYWWSGDKRSN